MKEFMRMHGFFLFMELQDRGIFYFLLIKVYSRENQN